MTASKRTIKKHLPHKPVIVLMGHSDSPHAIAQLIKQAPAHNYKAVGFEFDEKINIDEFKKFCEKEFKIGADDLAKRTASMLRNNVMLSTQTLETWLNKYELNKDLIKSPEKAHTALGEAILMSIVSASCIQEYIETLKTENYSNKTIVDSLEAKAIRSSLGTWITHNTRFLSIYGNGLSKSNRHAKRTNTISYLRRNPTSKSHLHWDGSNQH